MPKLDGKQAIFDCPTEINSETEGNFLSELYDYLNDESESKKWTQIVLDFHNTSTIDTNNSLFFKEIMSIVKYLRERQKELCGLNIPSATSRVIADYGMDSAIKNITPKKAKATKASTGGTQAKTGPIDVEFVNPFINATLQALDVQCSTKATADPIFMKTDDTIFIVDIAAMLTISSNTFNGTIAISFPQKVFLKIMESMLGETYTEITSDLEDGAAELLNITFGIAKVELNEKNYGLEKAIPTVIKGLDLSLKFISNAPTLVVPFQTEYGPFYIEIIIKAND